MLRRNARLRKEYLYRKSLEGKERATYERKRQIRKALDGECGSGRLQFATQQYQLAAVLLQTLPQDH
jgi:hypothetical protein